MYCFGQLLTSGFVLSAQNAFEIFHVMTLQSKHLKAHFANENLEASRGWWFIQGHHTNQARAKPAFTSLLSRSEAWIVSILGAWQKLRVKLSITQRTQKEGGEVKGNSCVVLVGSKAIFLSGRKRWKFWYSNTHPPGTLQTSHPSAGKWTHFNEHNHNQASSGNKICLH